MLGHEDWMIMPWGLLPVVGGLGRRQSFFDEIRRVKKDFLHSFLVEIVPFFFPQVDTIPKRRSF